jgi:hypothetical protein
MSSSTAGEALGEMPMQSFRDPLMNKASAKLHLSSRLGAIASSALYLRTTLANIAHRLVVRRLRSRSQVASDYDQGEWRDVLESRRWDRCDSLEQYVLSGDGRPITAMIGGELTRIGASEYYAYRTKVLAETVRRFGGDAEALVEIGSGAGRNLFALAYAGHWSKLLGLELSPTGREVTQRVAERFSLSSVHSAEIDLLDPSSPGFDRLRGATVFSFYCLEQLPAHTREVMQNLLSAGVRRVIHIEPTPELFSYLSLKDLATISYIWRQDYQRTIVSVARRMEEQGLIRVLEVARLNFAPSCRNDPTLVVWEPLDVPDRA